MRDENPIRTLGDYSKPSHKGYRNTIELPVGNNVLAIGLNAFQYDPSPHGMILLPDSLLNSFHREGPRTIDQSTGGKLRDLNAEESGALLEDLSLYDNESWNDLRDFAKPVKAIALPQGVPSTSDRRLVELENQVQHLMEAYLDPTQPTQVKKSLPYVRSAMVLTTLCIAWKTPNKPLLNTHPRALMKREQPKESQVNESDVGQEDEGSLRNINPNPYLQPGPLASIATKQVRKLNSMLESLRLIPRSSNAKFICSKEDDGEGETTEAPTVEYFDTFPTRDELTYHREDANGGVSNFTGRIKGMHIFVGNFTYIVDFMIIEDISSIIDPRLTQVVLWKPFIKISNMTHDQQECVVRFVNENDEVAYKMPHKIEQYTSLSNLEKKHTKLVYLRNKEDKKRGVEYVMSKILGFYKECLELGPEYLTGVEDKGEVTEERVTLSLATRLVIFDEKKLGSS
ncbi:hypothetical protein Tco_0015574 [Tanacetum coccineum]